MENSSPRQTSWTNDGTSVYAEEERELVGVRGAMDVPRAEALARLHEHRVARVVRHVLGSPAPRRRDPVLDEEVMRLELVRHARGGVSASGRRTSAGASRSRSRASTGKSRSLSGTTRRTSCSSRSAAERGHVRRVGDPRDDDVAVAVVERGRERIGVDAERDGARRAERRDDVDALPDRREHDDHDARAYSEDSDGHLR